MNNRNWGPSSGDKKKTLDLAFADLLVGSDGSQLLASKTTNPQALNVLASQQASKATASSQQQNFSDLDFDLLTKTTAAGPVAATADLEKSIKPALVPVTAGTKDDLEYSFGFSNFGTSRLEESRDINSAANSTKMQEMATFDSDFLASTAPPTSNTAQTSMVDSFDVFNVAFLEQINSSRTRQTLVKDTSPVSNTIGETPNSRPRAQTIDLAHQFSHSTLVYEARNLGQKASVPNSATLSPSSSQESVAGESIAQPPAAYVRKLSGAEISAIQPHKGKDIEPSPSQTHTAQNFDEISQKVAKTANSWMAFARSKMDKAIAAASQTDVVKKANVAFSHIQSQVKAAAFDSSTGSREANGKRADDSFSDDYKVFFSRTDSLSAFGAQNAAPANATQPLERKEPKTVVEPPLKPLVTASPEQLACANAEKNTGNEYFKQGQFALSVEHYSKAIAALPAGHLDLLPLLNNRAAARLKTGDYKEAVDDTLAALEFDSGDSKALLRGAVAYEELEKWDSALKNYRKLQALGIRTAAVSGGITRCQSALKPKNEPTNSDSVPSIAAAPSRARELSEREISNSEAVQRIRQQDLLKEKDQATALELKDKVDLALKNWKSGKESNLRALIATLDGVLWPGSGWQTVSLAELVEPGKCKIKYMKAIAKVHPDKVSVQESIENKLIASGVFTILNKAWDEFKTSNNLS